MKPIFSYQGGKRRLAKHILPLFPVHTCYVEPFCGGAALYFMKQPAKTEVINDINGEIVNLFKVVQSSPDALSNMFDWCIISRQLFNELKHVDIATLSPVERAYRFMYLQMLNFGGKSCDINFAMRKTKPHANIQKEKMMQLFKDAHLRMKSTAIENMAWDKCIASYDTPETLFYCDPPYWGTGGYGMGFELSEYYKMAELAKSIKGKMIVSVGDSELMRDIFSGLEILEVETTYKISPMQNKKQAKELIILNF